MATFTERIRLIFDVDTNSAQTGFRGFVKSVREAEGISGKLKAGVGSLGATLKQNLGPAALAAAAALVTFGVKATQAFTQTAKAAIDLGKATGLTTEQASRWVAIGDDFGVTADQLTASLGRVGKTLESSKWAEYGIETRDAGGRARSTNDIILDTLDMLAKMPNATERAAAGNALFGKGYASLAPLIGKSRDELEDYLGSVSDGQVITDKEAAKAEKMRLAWDKISDAMGDVALALGELLSRLAPLFDLLGDLLGVLDLGIGKLDEFAEAVASIDWTDPVGGADELMNKMKDLVREAQNAADATGESGAFQGSLDTLRGMLEDVRLAGEKVRAEFDKMRGELNEEDQFADVSLSLLGLRRELEDIGERFQNGDITGEEAWIMAGQAIRDRKKDVADYAQEVLKLPPDQTTEILTLIDEGKFEEALRRIEALTKARDVPVRARVSVSGSMAGEAARGYASGTRSAAPGVALVGENGPELVNFRGGESVLPAGPTRAALGGAPTYNITVQTLKADADIGRVIVDAINAHTRNGGRGVT